MHYGNRETCQPMLFHTHENTPRMIADPFSWPVEQFAQFCSDEVPAALLC
jgi:hypothetical protein